MLLRRLNRKRIMTRYRRHSFDFAVPGDGEGEGNAPSSSQAQDRRGSRVERLGKRFADKVEADLSGDLDAGPSSSRRHSPDLLGDDGNESDGGLTTVSAVSSVISAVTLGTASAISMSIDALRSQLTWIQHRLRPAFEVADGKNSTPEDTLRYEKLKAMEVDARASLVEALTAVGAVGSSRWDKITKEELKDLERKRGRGRRWGWVGGS